MKFELYFCFIFIFINNIINKAKGLNEEDFNYCISLSNNFPFCFTHSCSSKILNDNKTHKLAIVVPFRDRFDELLYFVPILSKFLVKKSIDFKIYIINQADNYRFNRAALINIGFLFSMKECDYMAMHDVDLLPLNTHLDYGYPFRGPFHVSTPDLHPRYHYKEFIGGILIINKKHYLKVNGMSNRFYGWGREDDEFYMRLKEANLTVYRPNVTNFKSDRTNTFLHNHVDIKRRRDYTKNKKQKRDAFKRDLHTGLDNIEYRVQNSETLYIGNYSCQLINVQLFCNKILTPWCEFEYQFM